MCSRCMRFGESCLRHETPLRGPETAMYDNPMIDPLHETEEELKHRYERPTQGWVCGWASAGLPCRLGPGPGGRCETRAECVPHRDGDRWHCARAAASGGPCEAGPLPDGRCGLPIAPCQPVRGLRARRGVA